jgi:hypothetical protein
MSERTRHRRARRGQSLTAAQHWLLTGSIPDAVNRFEAQHLAHALTDSARDTIRRLLENHGEIVPADRLATLQALAAGKADHSRPSLLAELH